jgi:glucosamine kinase
MTFIVAGVDGGGSKTHVIIADETGQQLGEVVGPGSAARPGEIEHSADVIAATLRDALASCEMSHVTPKVVCVGVAGAARDPEREQLWTALMGREVAEEVVVHPDFSIALDDAFGDGPGILLISGTGSAAFGRGPAGHTARCGGWGLEVGALCAVTREVVRGSGVAR